MQDQEQDQAQDPTQDPAQPQPEPQPAPTEPEQPTEAVNGDEDEDETEVDDPGLVKERPLVGSGQLPTSMPRAPRGIAGAVAEVGDESPRRAWARGAGVGRVSRPAFV